MPVTHVSAAIDSLAPAALVKLKALNTISRDAYAMYDAQKMDGLPIGVQIVGRRLEEEKVLAGMKLVERVLKERGLGYDLLKIR